MPDNGSVDGQKHHLTKYQAQGKEQSPEEIGVSLFCISVIVPIRVVALIRRNR